MTHHHDHAADAHPSLLPLLQQEELRLETKKDQEVTVTVSKQRHSCAGLPASQAVSELVPACLCVLLQLLSGTAEIFGCELSLQQPLDLKGHTLAVFSWEGCKLRVEGTPELM